MRDLPETWKTAASRAGIAGSASAIGRAAGVSTNSVLRLALDGKSSQETVLKVAAALRLDPEQVYNLAGIEQGRHGPWVPPPEAYRLPPRAREALNELIRAFVEGVEDGQQEPTSEGGADVLHLVTKAAKRGRRMDDDEE